MRSVLLILFMVCATSIPAYAHEKVNAASFEQLQDSTNRLVKQWNEARKEYKDKFNHGHSPTGGVPRLF